MSIGVNWKEIWDDVWKDVWEGSGSSPSTPSTGGGENTEGMGVESRHRTWAVWGKFRSQVRGLMEQEEEERRQKEQAEIQAIAAFLAEKEEQMKREEAERKAMVNYRRLMGE